MLNLRAESVLEEENGSLLKEKNEGTNGLEEKMEIRIPLHQSVQLKEYL